MKKITRRIRRLSGSYLTDLSFLGTQTKLINQIDRPKPILEYVRTDTLKPTPAKKEYSSSRKKQRGGVKQPKPTQVQIKQVIDFKNKSVSVLSKAPKAEDKYNTTKIKIGTYSGVKKVLEVIKDKEVRDKWGLSNQQYKAIQNITKKFRQADKSNKESKKQSAMREFYRAVGLTPEGKVIGTDNKLFTTSRPRREAGQYIGGGVVFANIPIKQNIPKLQGRGSIDELGMLADNIDLVRLALQSYSIEHKLSSLLIGSEYDDWVQGFITEAQLGEIDYRLLGALGYIVENAALLKKTANWLANRGLKLSLSGSISDNIKQLLSNVKDIPPDIKLFLTQLNNRLK